MRFGCPCLIVAFVLAPMLLGSQEAGDVTKFLHLAAGAEPKEAIRHLTKVASALADDKALTRGERYEMTVRLARLLLDKAQGTADVEAVLGAKAVKQVSRQLFFRRYLEQWSYEAPVRLCVTLEWPRGKEVVIRAILPLAESP